MRLDTKGDNLMNSRREIWTKKHGQIPKGWISINLNGQPVDDRVENLAAIPRKTNSLYSIVAPFCIRIRRLERLLMESKIIEEKEKWA